MKFQSTSITTAAFLVLSLLAYTPRSALAGTTTFSNGQTDQWQFSAAANIVPDGGNPGAYVAFQAIDTFGINVFNDSNPEFIGSVYQSPVTISIDVQTNSITFMGNQVSRDLFVELSDTSTPNEGGYPGTSLFYDLGTMSSFTPGWIHYSVTIADPNSTVLPPGWSGTGAEDANGNPILPPGQTFASVLQNVDSINFTTFEPGFVFGDTNFDLGFDNLGVNAVPEPSSLTLLGIAVLGLAGIARQKVSRRASGLQCRGD
jgi:PEP-CTERM motif